MSTLPLGSHVSGADDREINGALGPLTLAVALVVDGAGARDHSLQWRALATNYALRDALLFARGRPSDALWRTACTSVEEFVRDAERGELRDHAHEALDVLRRFVDENVDVV